MLLEVCGEKLNISYIDEGGGDTVLLLHGWGASGKAYRTVIDMLTPHFRVVAPDMPGFGASDEPSFPYNAENYADFVGAVYAGQPIYGSLAVPTSLSADMQGDLITLEKGCFMITLADDAHMPCVHLDVPQNYRKAVAKLRV